MDEKVQELFILMLIVAVTLAAYMLYRPQRKVTKLNLRQSLDDGKSTQGGVREVNVIFQFNGHDFDAYEVLGVPAGSRREDIQKAYEKSLAAVGPDGRMFIEMAFKAIVKN